MLKYFCRPAVLIATLALVLLPACEPIRVEGPALDRRLSATLLTAGDGVEVNGRPASSGQTVSSGDRVWTGPQGSALVRFSDDTTIQIIDAIHPVYLRWSGDRLTMRMDDAAIEASKGFFIRVIEAVGQLARIFHESDFVVEERRTEFFRLDLFSGRARVVQPPTGGVVGPGQYALITPDGDVEIGRVSPRRLRELRARFGRWDFSRVERPRVPNVIDRRLGDALAEIERAGLAAGRISGPETRGSYVVSQDPRPGARVRPGSRVDLVLRDRTVTTIRVPDVRKRSYAEARKVLADRDLGIGRVSGPQTRGSYVVSQDPRPGARVRPGSRVDLVLQGQTVKTVAVPDVRQLLVPQAIDRLARAGLKPGRVSGGTSGDAYYVVNQSPSPGRRVRVGSTVDLQVQGVIQ